MARLRQPRSVPDDLAPVVPAPVPGEERLVAPEELAALPGEAPASRFAPAEMAAGIAD